MLLGLYLNGLTEISPDVIDVLANGNSGLSFQGLEFVDSDVEQAFLDAEKKLEAAGRVLLRREQTPWLRLVSHHQEGSAAKGETWSLVWNLRANLVGNLEVQALHIKEGKSHVVSEVKCPVDGQRLIDVQLQLKSLDEPLTSKGHVFAPSLSIMLDGIATKSIETEKLTWLGDFAVYSLSMSGMPSVNSKNLLLQAANVPIVVTPDRLDDSIDDMIKASKKGDDYFAFALAWEPIDKQTAPSPTRNRRGGSTALRLVGHYSTTRTTAQTIATTMVRFAAHDWDIEIFCQPIAVERQWGVRHFRIEQRILKLAPRVAPMIRAMKEAGLKTEPAFASLLGLKGDPYAALLELENQTDEALRSTLLLVPSDQ